MRFKKSKKSMPDYSKLFETLPKKEFLFKIFFNKRFAEIFSCCWDINLENNIKKINQIFAYFHEDDLYKYFEINHSIHKDKPKLKYLFCLFQLLTDLHDSTSAQDFIELEDIYFSNSIYIYYQYPKVIPELGNISRDILYYGYTPRDARDNYGYNSKYFNKVLKKIYQEELLPLDITC